VAEESGISASTLTRISQGKRPDVDGLSALLAWSGLQMDDFIVTTMPRAEVSTVARISTSLRADKHLPPRAAEAIEKIVRVAYDEFREDEAD
jgi:transcriptional regulator with XRE-family HTH domain